MATYLLIAASDSEGQLIYVIAVIILSVVGWVVERMKKEMAEAKRRKEERFGKRFDIPAPRPETRKEIPTFREEPPARRPAAPAAPTARPRPPARPPVPQRPPIPPMSKPRSAPSRPAEPQDMETVWEVLTSKAKRGMPAPKESAPPPPKPQPIRSQEGGGVSSRPLGKALAGAPTMSVRQAAPALTAKDAPRQPVAPTAVPLGGTAVPATSLRHLNPAELRRAFILKELLDPPLALRGL